MMMWFRSASASCHCWLYCTILLFALLLSGVQLKQKYAHQQQQQRLLMNRTEQVEHVVRELALRPEDRRYVTKVEPALVMGPPGSGVSTVLRELLPTALGPELVGDITYLSVKHDCMRSDATRSRSKFSFQQRSVNEPFSLVTCLLIHMGGGYRISLGELFNSLREQRPPPLLLVDDIQELFDLANRRPNSLYGSFDTASGRFVHQSDSNGTAVASDARDFLFELYYLSTTGLASVVLGSTHTGMELELYSQVRPVYQWLVHTAVTLQEVSAHQVAHHLFQLLRLPSDQAHQVFEICGGHVGCVADFVAVYQEQQQQQEGQGGADFRRALDTSHQQQLTSARLVLLQMVTLHPASLQIMQAISLLQTDTGRGREMSECAMTRRMVQFDIVYVTDYFYDPHKHYHQEVRFVNRIVAEAARQVLHQQFAQDPLLQVMSNTPMPQLLQWAGMDLNLDLFGHQRLLQLQWSDLCIYTDRDLERLDLSHDLVRRLRVLKSNGFCDC